MYWGVTQSFVPARSDKQPSFSRSSIKIKNQFFFIDCMKQASMDLDLVITNTLVLTMQGKGSNVIENGAIGITDGELVYVGPNDGLNPDDADQVIDGTDHLTMPGLVNAHVHTHETLLRGAAQDVPEAEWMDHALSPFVSQLNDDDRICGCKLGVLEAVRCGATTIGEYAAGVADLIEAVYRPYGVRVAATETINMVDRESTDPSETYVFDEASGEAALARNEALFDQYGDGGLVTAMYGPQALDMVSLELLSEIRDRATEHDRRIHMHVAQGGRESRQIAARYGKDASAVSVLDEHDLLNERFLAAHCHGASSEERALLAERGASLMANPSSIAAIDGVVPPIVEYLEYDGTVTIGTDQAPGPGGHNAFREMRTASLLAKTDATDPTTLPAWRALRLLTIDGARALGLDDRIGSLEPGKRADVITIDLRDVGIAPTVDAPFHTAIPNLVYAATGREVETVLIDGEVVVQEKEFISADVDAVVDESEKRAERVFEEAAEDWRAADSELVARVEEGWL
jgi:5-methylthioadenosine/S-adenosylhomocysteine deaminase